MHENAINFDFWGILRLVSLNIFRVRYRLCFYSV